MKNITVSVDEDVYHAARVAAAERRTSVSAMVRRYLGMVAKGSAPEWSEEADGREELVRLFQEANLNLGYKPRRARTYER